MGITTLVNYTPTTVKNQVVTPIAEKIHTVLMVYPITNALSTYAVIALKSGDDVKTVQENLGHATASFTLDTYGHVTEKMKKDSADRMEAFIQSVR